MAQDQLFKELLREFFREFIELFYPQVAERLDFDRVEFLDKEAFTDLPKGRRREADLLVRVYTRDGAPEIIIIHIEVQARREREVPGRIFEYYGIYRFRHRLPILPIVLYLAPARAALRRRSHTEGVLGINVLRFVYQVVGLPDLEFDEYHARANPLAPTLSVLMRPGASGDALRKALIVRQRAIIEQNEARRSMLMYVVDTYLPLSAAEQKDFEAMQTLEEFIISNDLTTSWERRAREKIRAEALQEGIAQGVEQGLAQGIEQGVEQGIEQGVERGIEQGLVQGMRRMLLRQMDVKFGPTESGGPCADRASRKRIGVGGADRSSW